MEQLNPTKVSLVDDDFFCLELMKSQLESLGDCAVTTCNSGRDFFESLENEHPELTFIDIDMPGMDGVQVMRELSELEYSGAVAILSGQDTRIVETTAKLAKAYKLNLIGCLSKPATIGRIHEMVEGSRLHFPLTTKLTAHRYSADDISDAINRGEFENYYQPQVRLSDGELVGIETLVRWQHPEHGLVLPDQFIGIAEDNKLITSITDLVLKEAIVHAKLWHELGIQARVSANISMDDILELDFPDKIEAALSGSSMQPINFSLELTESRLMSNDTAWLDILIRLRLKHIGLSIDDFGTGYSSLSKLRDFPFTELKIDKSFVHKAHSDETLSAIFLGSEDIGDLLGIRVVAEGVEDIEDWKWVQQQNCEIAQGFFIARPMPAEKIPEWLQEWQTRKVSLILH